MADAKQAERVRTTILAHDKPSAAVAFELASLAENNGLGNGVVGALESYHATALEAEEAKATLKDRKALAGKIWEDVVKNATAAKVGGQ
jgi:hypothetical protein